MLISTSTAALSAPFIDYARPDRARPAPRATVLDQFEQVADRFLDRGGYILRQLEQDEPDFRAVTTPLLAAGYLEWDPDNHLKIGVRGLRHLEEQALRDVLRATNATGLGKHADSKLALGHDQLRVDSRRPYRYGDPLTALDLHETLKNGLRHHSGAGQIGLREDDLVVHEVEPLGRCATVLLLDQSGSMARYGKFVRAKLAALALIALVRQRFREDDLFVVGFATVAERLQEAEVLRAMPKPVKPFLPDQPRRVPRDQAKTALPGHFTNLQDGFRLARRFLKTSSVGAGGARQIICVTDGEPTAHLDGPEVVVVYPPSEGTARATLEESRRCAVEGIGLSILAVADESAYHGFSVFIERLARQSHGRVVPCPALQLGGAVLASYLAGRRVGSQLR